MLELDGAVRAFGGGDTTDIVHLVYKEMYTFPDRKGRSLTMRPENTAGVAGARRKGPPCEHRAPRSGSGTAAPSSATSSRRKDDTGSSGRSEPSFCGASVPLADAELLVMLSDFLRRLGFSDFRCSQLRPVASSAAAPSPRRCAPSLEPPRRASRHRRPPPAGGQPAAHLRLQDEETRGICKHAPEELASHLDAEARTHFATV